MFIHDDFLINSPAGCRLYHDYAAKEPIFDYHNHLSPKDAAENRSFSNLYEVWLEEDHYKWRAMRRNGCDERLISGDASQIEKYEAWASTVPMTLCNPLYHWTHLELKRFFGIETLLNSSTAAAVWNASKERIEANPDQLSVHQILDQLKVQCICTTDDPADDLRFHIRANQSNLKTRVLPTFRPDNAMAVDAPDRFNQWIKKLESVANVEIRNLSSFVDAIKLRHDFFHQHGCRFSDHDLRTCPANFPADNEASQIFERARIGQPADALQRDQFFAYMMDHFCRWDHEQGWTKQLHIGVFRNNNARILRDVGPDMGYDSIGDFPQGEPLRAFLSRCDLSGILPRTILYNNNPRDNFLFATMADNFPERVRYGAAWWYMDQKDGIESHLRDIGNVSLLSHFVGMLTDSRSYLSLSRHEYFRRVLCNLVGNKIDLGELPRDFELVGSMIQRICYQNAVQFTGLDDIPNGSKLI